MGETVKLELPYVSCYKVLMWMRVGFLGRVGEFETGLTLFNLDSVRERMAGILQTAAGIRGGHTRLFRSGLLPEGRRDSGWFEIKSGADGGVPRALPIAAAARGTRQGSPFATNPAGGRSAIAEVKLNMSKSEPTGARTRLRWQLPAWPRLRRTGRRPKQSPL